MSKTMVNGPIALPADSADRTLETVDAISCMLRGMMGTMHPTIGYNDLTIDLHLASVLYVLRITYV